jgi:hypothetical protein
MDAEILRLLRLYREAQLAYWVPSTREDATVDKRTIFSFLLDICLKNHGEETTPPALFSAICRGPRNDEASGADWNGVEVPITEMDGERVVRLWNAVTGRSNAR